MWQSDLFDDSEQGDENIDDNQPVSVSKRRRITQACEPCRRKKSKCDGGQPCSICQSLGRHCQYGTANRRRGLPAGYVRSLEILLGSALKENEALGDDLRLTLRNKFDDVRFTEGDVAESLLDTWRKSETAKDVETLLSFSQDVDSSSKSRHIELSKVSPSTILPTLPTLPMENQNVFNARIQNAMSQIYVTISAEPFIETQRANDGLSVNRISSERLQVLPESHDRNTVTPQTLSVNEVADMVDFYFLHTHCWFPMLDKSIILRLLHSKRSLNDGHIAPSDDLVVLWAILAYASVQMKASNILPTITMTPQDIYSTARSLIPCEDHKYDVRHVQALVLLTLVNLGSSTPEKAWILLGQAVRMLEVPIKQDKVASSRACSSGQTQKFCAFVDTLTAAVVGKTPYFTPEELMSTVALEEDGLDEWSTWNPPTNNQQFGQPRYRVLARSISVFNSLFSLIIILGEILRPSNVVAFEETVSELRVWRKNLPEHCQLKNGHAPTPAVAHLHLAWICTVSSLQRRSQGGVRPDLTTNLRAEEFSDHLLNFLQSCVGDFGRHTLPSTFVTFLTCFVRLAPYTVLSQLSLDAFSMVETNLDSHLQEIVLVWRPILPSTMSSYQPQQTSDFTAHDGMSRPARLNEDLMQQVTPLTNSWRPPQRSGPQHELSEIELPEIPDLELEGTLLSGDFESLLQEIGTAESVPRTWDLQQILTRARFSLSSIRNRDL